MISKPLCNGCDIDDENLPPEIRALMGIHVMYWKIDEQFEGLNVDPPLGKQERHLLVRLEAPKRMGVLAQQMAALPSTVTGAADALEERGLVVRERDPDDRRAWRVSLTTEGEKVRRDFLNCIIGAFSDLSGLTAQETERFASLAWKIRENILKDGIPEGMKSENL